MRIDAGILPDSVRFFHEPDAFTEQALYHTPHVGVYHCDSQYNFSRAGETCLDICQAIFVDHGALTVRYREQEITASPGMLILLDCREPHEYFAVSPEIRFRWFHIVGASSFAYIAHIIQSHGFVIQTAKNADHRTVFRADYHGCQTGCKCLCHLCACRAAARRSRIARCRDQAGCRGTVDDRLRPVYRSALCRKRGKNPRTCHPAPR